MDRDAQIQDIQNTVNRIEEALVGRVGDNDSIGLIEEQRNHTREIKSLRESQDRLVPQVAECVEFKRDIRKVVIGIAAIIPFLFEVIKLGAGAIWEYIKTHAKP